jgi:F-type H+-transporting ATPase subunit gamma
MSTLNAIKDQQIVVNSVGSFASSLQQISAARMVKLRNKVIDARQFVEEATLILRELQMEKSKILENEAKAAAKSKLPLGPKKAAVKKASRSATIVITSNQGLCGSYNTDIIRKMETMIPKYPNLDYFVIGSKGQEYFRRAAKKFGIRYYPFNVAEEVSMYQLKPLVSMFYYYDRIYLVYSKYINTTTHEVDFIELAVPHVEEIEARKELIEGKFIFEPNLDDLISSVNAKLRYALFRQQILDSKLSLYTSQMIAMQTASENAKNLLADLQLQYNKARRKQVDKKIQEVQAGRSLWANE